MLRIIKFQYVFLLFILTVIPSSLYISLKIYVVLLSLLLQGLLLISLSYSFKMRDVFWFGFINIFLYFWFFLSSVVYSNAIDIAFRAYSGLVGLYLSVVVMMQYDRFGVLSKDRVLYYFVVFVFVYCFIKLFVIFLPSLGYFSARDIESMFAGGNNINYRTEGQGFVRLNTINDNFVIFGLYLLLFDKRLQDKVSVYIKGFMIIVFAGVLLFSFTRYLWLIGFVVVLLYSVKNKFKKLGFIGFASLMFIYVFVNNGELMNELFVRYSDYRSLSVKLDQVYALIGEFFKYPLFGKGLGGYVDSYIRSAYLPFVYEVQWLSLALQFGFFGLIVVLCVFFYPIRLLISVSKYEAYVLLFVYSGFLLSGFTNPNLLSMSSSVIYFIVMVISSTFEDDHGELSSFVRQRK